MREISKFIDTRGIGTHFFRGNLIECKPIVKENHVIVYEEECTWKEGLLNRVEIGKSSNGKEKYEFLASCF